MKLPYRILVLDDDENALSGIVELLREHKMDDVLVVVGGIIPDADVPKLNAIGITGVFQPGTPMQNIVEFIRGHVTAKVD